MICTGDSWRFGSARLSAKPGRQKHLLAVHLPELGGVPIEHTHHEGRKVCSLPTNQNIDEVLSRPKASGVDTGAFLVEFLSTGSGTGYRTIFCAPGHSNCYVKCAAE